MSTHPHTRRAHHPPFDCDIKKKLTQDPLSAHPVGRPTRLDWRRPRQVRRELARRQSGTVGLVAATAGAAGWVARRRWPVGAAAVVGPCVRRRPCTELLATSPPSDLLLLLRAGASGRLLLLFRAFASKPPPPPTRPNTDERERTTAGPDPVAAIGHGRGGHRGWGSGGGRGRDP
jgi:hypothetical protein